MEIASDTALRIWKLRSLSSISLEVETVTLPRFSMSCRMRVISAAVVPRGTFTCTMVTWLRRKLASCRSGNGSITMPRLMMLRYLVMPITVSWSPMISTLSPIFLSSASATASPSTATCRSPAAGTRPSRSGTFFHR